MHRYRAIGPPIRSVARFRAISVLAALALCAIAAAGAAPPTRAIQFNIPAGQLADALDRFSEQSGLQVVYDDALLQGKLAATVTGEMSVSEALDHLLAGMGLAWDIVSDRTVVVMRAASPALSADGRPPATSASAPADEPATSPTATLKLDNYIAFGRGEDPMGLLPTEPLDSVFGFGKSLLETPRSVSVLSDDVMASYGIATTLDVSKIIPSTYTASIFSVNGNVNIRSVSSDTYFRGIKRLENTQLFPSPLSAMSRIDIVRGPPSPLYGPGKAGGYTNLVPKSARASTGKYLEEPTGKATLTTGSYDKKAGSAEIGGPFSLAGRRGGYYLYMDAEKSGTYYDHVPFEQYIVQSSFDVEPGERWIAQFGQMFQQWGGTELAGWNRVTQELIDHGTYAAGQPQLNMDLNGDGLISTAEVDAFGPLIRDLPPGTPASAAAAALGPGWRIDPATVRQVPLSRTANAQSTEDGAGAKVNLAYFDLVYRLPSGAALTNKIYHEQMRRFKWTRASAFGQDTRSSVFEDKVLYEQLAAPLTRHIAYSLAASASYRYYDTQTLTGTKYNDIVDRADLSQPFNSLNRFAVPNLEPDLAPWNTGLVSKYDTVGAAILLDVTSGTADVLLGARYDRVSIHSRIPDFVLTAPGLEARGSDAGLSWSASVSYEVLTGLRPYLTYSTQETLLHGIDGGVAIPIVANALNASQMREAGLKWSGFGGKVFAALSTYRQTRTSFTADTMQVPATLSKGWEMELRWVPSRRFSLVLGASKENTTFEPARAATIVVNPSFFGLGNDYYGGRLQTTLSNDPRYATRAGYPEKVFNLNGTFFFTRALAVNLSANYQQEVASGRIRDIVLPDAKILGAALIYDSARWTLRTSVSNLTNQLYFIPNSPDFAGEATVIPAPERNYEASISFKY
jgi:iron complex outermembrane recepter protein